jgi:hypothetical protein
MTTPSCLSRETVYRRVAERVWSTGRLAQEPRS